MASYFNLTLDTTAPSGVSVLINGDETKTTSTAVTLTITCDDADLTDYQMKIWGTADAETEADATWENFAATKNVTLPTRDGVKTVYVKLRDDVWNESITVSDTISLYTSVPTIMSLSANTAKVSLVNGKNTVTGSFRVSENIEALKMMIVNDINAAYDDPSNIPIPTENGSFIIDDVDRAPMTSAYMEFENVNYDSTLALFYDINAADIRAALPGDGVKIIKVFVRSAVSGNWSV